ncbi:beta-lactamase/transpeptidase-like protein [Cladochytrium replicatum]|nr:beta-lactamase/transpeptidase-like protein [Cladochytrium replicatum]
MAPSPRPGQKKRGAQASSTSSSPGPTSTPNQGYPSEPKRGSYWEESWKLMKWRVYTLVPVLLFLIPQWYFSHGPFTPLSCVYTTRAPNHTFAMTPGASDPDWRENIDLVIPGCQSYPLKGFAIAEMEHLMHAFYHNFEVGDEIGAQLVAYVDGKKVVDVVGGWKDLNRKEQYQPDSLQLVFSTSKSVESIIIAWLVERNLLNYNEKVSAYWPEFGQGNKSDVLLSDVLGHRAGVTWVDEPVTPQIALEAEKLAKIIEKQPHNFGGVRSQAYHAVTRGWILNEIVRRVDPARRGMSEILRDDILPTIPEKVSDTQRPEFYFGVPQSELSRVAPIIGPPLPWYLYHMFLPESMQRDPIPPVMTEVFLKTKSVGHKAAVKSFKTTGIWPASFQHPDVVIGSNSLSYGGFSNARSIGLLAAYLAGNGTFNGNTILSAETLAKALQPLPEYSDPVLGVPVIFTSGGWGKFDNFWEGTYGSAARGWYGWMGSGGSMMYFNPRHNLAFAYVMNGARPGGYIDRRCRDLMKAFIEAYQAIETAED